MAGFEDVTLSWNGIEYVIPATKMMMVVCRIEDVLCQDEDDNALDVLLRKRPPARLAAAFEAALNAAGARIEPGEVYISIMSALADGDANSLSRTMETVMALLALIAPPVHHRLVAAQSSQNEGPEKK